jgi:hypothetical protein
MLETTLATEFEPGTNIKGGVVAGASWAFALPSLELERVVCLGPPPEATLRTLAELGRRVLIICTRRRQLASLRGKLAGSGHRNVALVLARNDGEDGAADCEDGAADREDGTVARRRRSPGCSRPTAPPISRGPAGSPAPARRWAVSTSRACCA